MNERRAFGERLRRQRERQHVTLEEIAETTKVAASLFAALERGDCTRWPGGFYSRCFIRGYAAAVQLDPAETAAEFAECYHATDAPTQTPVPSAPKAAPRTAAAPLRLSLDADPTERYRLAARRAAQAFADLVIIVALAYLVVLSAGVSFWLSLATTGLAYHVLGRFVAISPMARLMSPAPRAAPQPAADVPDGGAPVGDAASTIA